MFINICTTDGSITVHSDHEILYNSEKEWVTVYMAMYESQKQAEWKKQAVGKYTQYYSFGIEFKKVGKKKPKLDDVLFRGVYLLYIW